MQSLYIYIYYCGPIDVMLQLELIILSLILHVLFLAIFVIYHCCVDHMYDSTRANCGSDHDESDVEEKS